MSQGSQQDAQDSLDSLLSASGVSADLITSAITSASIDFKEAQEASATSTAQGESDVVTVSSDPRRRDIPGGITGQDWVHSSVQPEIDTSSFSTVLKFRFYHQHHCLQTTRVHDQIHNQLEKLIGSHTSGNLLSLSLRQHAIGYLRLSMLLSDLFFI